MNKEIKNNIRIIIIILLSLTGLYIICSMSGLFESDAERLARFIKEQDIKKQEIIKQSSLKKQKIEAQIKSLTREKNILDICIQKNKKSIGQANLPTICDSSLIKNKATTKKKKVVAEILKQLNLEDCRITQDEEHHVEAWNGRSGGHVYATDIACIPGQLFKVYAPNYKPYYVVSAVGYDKIIGDFIVLKHGDRKYLFAHTKTTKKVGDKIMKGDYIGDTNISGMSTGMHLHFEFWYKGNNVDSQDRINPFNQRLKEQRGLIKKENNLSNTFALTTYDLGDVKQNDSSPCIGASGKNLCKLAEQGIQTIALVKPIREKFGIKFGDNIVVRNIDTNDIYIVQVEDEMNKRFRNKCIKGVKGLCIRGDIARYKGKAELPSGAYEILIK